MKNETVVFFCFMQQSEQNGNATINTNTTLTQLTTCRKSETIKEFYNWIEQLAKKHPNASFQNINIIR